MACLGGCRPAKGGEEGRLSPAELSRLLGDRKVREALQDVGVASLLPPVGMEVFRRFTPASLQDIEQRRDAKGAKDKQHKPADQLTNGKPLPFIYGAPPPELLYTPLEELDPYYQSQKTFLVLSRGNILHRFNADSSLYLLSPLNHLRTWSTRILLSPWFRWFVLVTLLINCVFMILPPTTLTAVMECVFVAVYSVEVLLKVVSRGFCVGRFCFIRDAWNFLDLLVLATSYPSFFVDYGRWSVTIPRVLKILSATPCLRRTVEALGQSARRFVDVFVIAALSLCVLAIVGVQLYMGQLRNKCVRIDGHFYNNTGYYGNLTTGDAEFYYVAHVLNNENWYTHPHHLDPVVCGNSSSAGDCPVGYMCLAVGPNPTYGYTSYDSFAWSLLTMFRLLTQDFWEHLFQLSRRAIGLDFTIILLLVFMPTCFLVLSLVLAAVVMVTVDQDRAALHRKRRDEEEFRRVKAVLEEVPGSAAPSKASLATVVVAEEDVEGGPPSCWQRPILWLRPFILSPLFDLGVVVCLVLNTVVMATEHYPMTEQHEEITSVLNLVFLGVFAAEMVFRLLALGLRGYLQVSWHILDVLVVVVGLVELGVADVEGLAVLRCSRVLRMFRLARWWAGLQLLLQVVRCAVQGLTAVLLVLVFMWVVVGQQLFQQDYKDLVCKISIDCELPRWHMADLPHSIMMVFRVLYGEWIETLWDCMEVSGPGSCLTYFIPMVVLAKLLVLLLFLNLLLNSTTTERLAVLENRVDLQTRTVTRMCRRARKDQDLEECVGLTTLTSQSDRVPGSGPVHVVPVDAEEDDKKIKFDVKQKGQTLEDCCCCPLQDVDTSRGWWKTWSDFRRFCLVVVENKVFEGFMIFIILLSSMVLVFEDMHLEHNPLLQLVLDWADLVFTLVFLVEVLLKWTAFGFRKYFSDVYCWLDFLVLVVSLVALVCEGLGVSCRPLRALRTLRILSRFQGPRVVLRSLRFTLPPMLQVAPVVLFLWLAFGIVGVNLFAGTFSYCFNETSEEWLMIHDINNRSECLILEDFNGITWKNAVLSFDNIMMSFLSLLTLATSKGIMDLLYFAVDSRGVELQPSYESNLHLSLYFLCFLVFGCFFSFLLFIRVFVRSIQQHRVEIRKHVFVTEEQQIYPEGFKKRLNTPWTCPRPQNVFQARLFSLVSSRWFEAGMMAVVFLNLAVLGSESYHSDKVVLISLSWTHLVLILVFLLELVLKLVAFRRFYFSSGLNVLDMLVLLASIINLFLSDVMSRYVVDLDPVVLLRLFRLTRVLWLFAATRGIVTLFLTFIMSLPALVNIGFLLFVVTYTYAAVGAMAFGGLTYLYMVDDMTNFQTFWNSLVTMTMVAPSTSWDGLLLPIMANPPDCDLHAPGSEVSWPCGTPAIGIIFFTSYILLFILLTLHLFTAVAMESFNARTPAEDREEKGRASKEVGGASDVEGGASGVVGGASDVEGGASDVEGGASEVAGEPSVV